MASAPHDCEQLAHYWESSGQQNGLIYSVTVAQVEFGRNLMKFTCIVFEGEGKNNWVFMLYSLFRTFQRIYYKTGTLILIMTICAIQYKYSNIELFLEPDRYTVYSDQFLWKQEDRNIYILHVIKLQCLDFYRKNVLTFFLPVCDELHFLCCMSYKFSG